MSAELPSRALSADVAREAGVSRATVSYVLNNTRGRSISDATRARVLEAAQRLGHVPHASARSLRLGRTNVVLALVNDFTFGFVRDEVLSALDEEMTTRGYVLLVHRYSARLRNLADLWPIVAPDVVVSMGGLSVAEADSIRDARTHFVSVQSLYDHVHAGEMQVDYLVSKGHSRLGYAFPAEPNVQSIAEERLAGSHAACERLGLPPPLVARVERGRLATFESALRQWAQSNEPPTAVCAHNDEIAFMLRMCAKGTIGSDGIAVIGMDDIPLSTLGITTVAIDRKLVTERIVEQVVASLEGRPARPNTGELLTIIARASA